MAEPADPRDWPEPEAGADYHVFSPSQVEEYLGCHRKWAFRKIARVHREEGASAKLGSEVHLELENFLSGKSLNFAHPRDAGYIAAAGIHLIPDPSVEGLTDDEIAQRARDVLIETEFRFQSARTGFVWNGRKDLELADSGLIPGLAEEAGLQCDENGRTFVPAVLDHKSTSNMRWAKTPDDLRWDVQANVYAYALMAERNVDTVDLAWVYYQTRNAKAAKRTHLRVHAAHAMRAFRLIEDVARDMARTLDASKRISLEDGPPDLGGFVRSLRPNPDACSAYGGCPYQHVCKLTTNERIKASMSTSDASFFDSIKKRAEAEDANAGGTPEAAPAAPASVMGCAPEDVPAPAGLPSWLAQATTSSAAAPATPPPASAAAPSTFTDPGINPPESAAPPPVQLPPEPPPPSTSSEDKPKGRGGRPKGSKNKAKDPIGADANLFAGTPATPAVIVPVEDVTPTMKAEGVTPITSEDLARPQVESNDPETLPPEDRDTLEEKTRRRIEALDSIAEADRDLEFPADGFTLYVDCFPVKGPSDVDDVAEYVAKAKATIAATDFPDGKGGTVRVADYRFLPFGQGAGALSTAVLDVIKANAPSHLVVSTRTAEGAIVVGDLIARAAFVVRGLS